MCCQHPPPPLIPPNVSDGQQRLPKLERRADMLVGTLRRYVEAMGGRLDIVATFPDGEVRISNLGELAPSEQ
jgi:hypothetical protein